jgi:hypothetical protein
MTWWSGYRRFVRVVGASRAMFVPRARCGPCGRTDAVLPAFVLCGRLDTVESIGAVVGRVGAVGGVRPAAVAAGVPHTTARGWVRRFATRAAAVALGFAAVAVELGGEVVAGVGDVTAGALGAIAAAFETARALPGWEVLGRWRFASVVSGGRLLAANTDSPYLIVGRRRVMAPVPMDGTGTET